ncbi:MAG TPA: aldo/keto reductase, partial [Candidatus Krumholzibacterium sp.]|nr:aldo/keto reductase [Candidatus Krumholzibacterium sp.]
MTIRSTEPFALVNGSDIYYPILMEKRILGRTDMNVSVVGFGGIPIQGLSFEESEKVILHAADSGINFFDSARGYTDSEEKIGRALRSRRHDIYLSTKAMSRDAASMRGELETSLKRLGTEMIDLYQMHAVGSTGQLERILGPGGAYEVLARAKEEGKVRWIGVTGHSKPVLLEAVASGRFDTVQFPFNPIEREWETELMPVAKAAGMGTIGMKPIAGGAIRHPALSIRYTLTRGMDVSIPGMDSIGQVDENSAAGMSLEPLSDEEISLLEEERDFWGEKFCRRCGYCLPCPAGLNIPFLLLL